VRVDYVKKGRKAPGMMSSAKSDKYIQNQRKLRHVGVDIRITTDDKLVSIAGIPVTPRLRVILCPGFAITQRKIIEKIGEGNVISDRSLLVLEGEGLRVKNLDLDGTLVIRTGQNCDVTVDGLIVRGIGGTRSWRWGRGRMCPRKLPYGGTP
jgi:UDP-sugar pyrophosphorylase